MLGLTEYLERKPAHLSGGQRQRVAMGRAIVREPSVFLMDEPLSNLDAKLRVQMRAEIADLQSRLGVTTVYVTHDQAEAMTLGHRVAVLSDGCLQQCAAPRVLYDRPANTMVAGFIGSPAMNLLDARLGTERLRLAGRRRRSRSRPKALAAAAGGSWRSVTVGIRPESLELAAEGIPALVEVVEEIGCEAHVFCTTELDGETTKLVASVEVRKAPKRGERVALKPLPAEAHLVRPRDRYAPVSRTAW